jgi:hypothetical protein
VLAFVRGVEPPEDLQVTVNVFLNCPYLSAETPDLDPHYMGNFTFFGVHGDHGGGDHHEESHEREIRNLHAEVEHDMKMSFAFDLTGTVERLRNVETDPDSQLKVQLMPVPLEARDVPPEGIRVGGVEIVYI